MHEHWERQWILVCLGIVSIATIAIGVAVASLDLLALNCDQQVGEEVHVVSLPPPELIEGEEVCSVTLSVRPAERRSIQDQYVELFKLLLIFVVAATYILLVARAQSAMFNTDGELAERGIDRRRAVRRVYEFLFVQLYFQLVLLSVVIVERWP